MVGEHVAIDDMGQPSFHAAERFHGGLAVGWFPVVLASSESGLGAESDDGHRVQDAWWVAGPRAQAAPRTLTLKAALGILTCLNRALGHVNSRTMKCGNSPPSLLGWNRGVDLEAKPHGGTSTTGFACEGAILAGDST